MEVSGSKANCITGFARERVPSTSLGTKEEKMVNERPLSSSSSSSLPPPSSTGQRLEKARGGTHRILEGWLGLGQDKGGGLWHLVLPTPWQKCTHTQPHTEMHTVFAHVAPPHWPTASFNSVAIPSPSAPKDKASCRFLEF